MIIRKYGLELIRLKDNADIELVRIKRNSDFVRQAMFYQEIITPEMQAKWFESQNNYFNYHFVIAIGSKKTGLVSCKNINYEMRTTEGGIFIWDEELAGTHIPVLASFISGEFVFNLLNLETNFAETRSDNFPALKYNSLLGYETEEMFPEEKKVKLKLNRKNFLSRSHKFLQPILNSTGEASPLSWNDIHFDNTNEEEIKRLYKNFPSMIQEEVDKRLLSRILKI